MLQFIFGGIISEKPISIGRNPNNSPGIMDDMITFKVDITYLILGINWKSLLSPVSASTYVSRPV